MTATIWYVIDQEQIYESSGNIANNTTRFVSFAQNEALNATEANVRIALPYGGRVTRLRVKTLNNTLNGALVVTVRKNGSDSGSSVSFNAGEDDTKEDTDQVAFDAEDDLTISLAAAGNAGNTDYIILLVVEFNSE